MFFCKLDKDEYRNFSLNHEMLNFMNTAEALALKKLNGWECEFIGVKEGDKVIAASLLVSRRVMKVFKLFYLQKGPLLDFNDKELVLFFTAQIKQYCKKNKGLYLISDPNMLYVQRDIDGNIVEGGFDNSNVIETMESCGWKHQKPTGAYDTTAYVRFMFALNLKDTSAEKLLKTVHPHVRYDIKRNERQGVKVRELGIDEIDIFIRMMDQTAKRRSFEARNHSFFKNALAAYGDKGKLLLAYMDVPHYKDILKDELTSLEKDLEKVRLNLESKPDNKKFKTRLSEIQKAIEVNNKRTNEAKELHEQYGDIINLSSMFFTIYDNEVLSLFGGSDDRFLKYSAPYLIQWKMIKYAIDNEIPRYNFYGISGNFDENSEDYGVYAFKRKFGGVVEELIGDFILPLKPLVYRIYVSLKKLI